MHEAPSLDTREGVPQKRVRTEHLDIPLESVLETQQFLMRTMVPKQLEPYMRKSDGEQVGIEDDLFMRWHEKYAEHFRNYCDALDPSTNAAHIERIQKGTLTGDDYYVIQQYLEIPGHGGFFFTDFELDVFIKQYIH
jgi:hypothetical protein